MTCPLGCGKPTIQCTSSSELAQECGPLADADHGATHTARDACLLFAIQCFSPLVLSNLQLKTFFWFNGLSNPMQKE